MKKVLLIGLVVVGVIVAPFVLMMAASESGEVVVVTIPAGSGATVVRLWVVDLDGMQYLRAGHESSDWYRNLLAAETVTVERQGQSAEYVPVPSLEVREEVAAEMLSKYGWREKYIAMLVGGREGAIPIALQPVG